jgi:hypothetical protein
MKKYKKEKFFKTSKSVSLTKMNPYLSDDQNHLPYIYNEPLFKTKYNGLIMQKDYYLMNMMYNRIKDRKNKLPKRIITTNNLDNLDIYKKTHLVFNSVEDEKKKFRKDYMRYIFERTKKKFFSFNPITSNGNNTKVKIIKKNDPNRLVSNFRRQIKQNNYKNWEEIKSEYINNGANKYDYIYDERNILEILKLMKDNEKKRNSVDKFIDNIREENKNRDRVNNIVFKEVGKTLI